MTEEDTPTPTPGCECKRVREGGSSAREPERRDEEEGEQHRRGEAVDSAQPRPAPPRTGRASAGRPRLPRRRLRPRTPRRSRAAIRRSTSRRGVKPSALARGSVVTRPTCTTMRAISTWCRSTESKSWLMQASRRSKKRYLAHKTDPSTRCQPRRSVRAWRDGQANSSRVPALRVPVRAGLATPPPKGLRGACGRTCRSGHRGKRLGNRVSGESADPAERVEACMQAHDLDRAQVVKTSGETRTFASCSWPAPDYAGADGYTEIQATSVDRSQFPDAGDTSEASGASVADRITLHDCNERQPSATPSAARVTSRIGGCFCGQAMS